LLERSKDIIADKMIQLERGLGIIKSIASIAPLLGLLGTVIGVLISFKEISKSGLDDPSVFASGISMALITTVVGLVVAIPHYLGYNFLIGILNRLEASLNKEVGDRL
jgi:biopolymer transport protein ExbB